MHCCDMSHYEFVAQMGFFSWFMLCVHLVGLLCKAYLKNCIEVPIFFHELLLLSVAVVNTYKCTICRILLCLVVKFRLQISHLNGFFLSWIPAICSFQTISCWKCFCHMSHIWRSFVATISLIQPVFFMNVQIEHFNILFLLSHHNMLTAVRSASNE